MEKYIIYTDKHHWTNLHALQKLGFNVTKKEIDNCTDSAHYTVCGRNIKCQLEKIQKYCSWFVSFGPVRTESKYKKIIASECDVVPDENSFDEVPKVLFEQ